MQTPVKDLPFQPYAGTRRRRTPTTQATSSNEQSHADRAAKKSKPMNRLTPEAREARKRYMVDYWNRRAEREASAQAEEPKATQPSKSTEKRAENHYREVASAMNREIKRPQAIEKLSRSELEARYHTLEAVNDQLAKEVMRLEGLLFVYHEDAKRIEAIVKDAVAQYPKFK